MTDKFSTHIQLYSIGTVLHRISGRSADEVFENNLENWRCMLKPLSRDLRDAGTDMFITYPSGPGVLLRRTSTKLKGQTYHLFRGEPYIPFL